MTGSRIDRKALREALRERYPWLDATEYGPAVVEAGECDRCGAEARLVETCGPVAWRYLGRGCAEEIGVEAWCEGHSGEAVAALGWLAALPAEGDAVARLWWVSTGEVRVAPDLADRVRALQLPEEVLRP